MSSRRGDDPGTHELGVLDGSEPDTLRGTMDQDDILRLQPCEVRQGIVDSVEREGRVAASEKFIPGGMWATTPAEVTTFEAKLPGAKAQTRSPGTKPLTPGPTPETTPAQSAPNLPPTKPGTASSPMTPLASSTSR